MRHNLVFRPLPVLLLALMVTACASQQPVLYPNGKLTSVGRAAAEQDINECMAQAESYGAGNRSGLNRTMTDTAEGAVVGGATGAAVGAVYGNAGRGAAVGSVGGATSRFAYGLLQSDEPDSLYKGFVNRCLRDRGYEPIGWN